MTRSRISGRVSAAPGQEWRVQKADAVVPRGGAVDLGIADAAGQRWMGFGGCFNELGWRALRGFAARQRRRVMEALFSADGCRFTFRRLPIGASDCGESWYSLNETANDCAMRHFSIRRDRGCLIRYAREALAIRPDLRFFASPRSPPSWMKFPAAYNYGTLVWTKRNLTAYALYLLRLKPESLNTICLR